MQGKRDPIPRTDDLGVSPGRPGVSIGSIVGRRFVVKAHLGWRCFGELYEVVDKSLSGPRIQPGRSVVLQMLNDRVARQPGLLERLESSYLQPHSWAHPNLMSVLAFGEDRERHFFVTESLEGANLRQILDETSPGLLSDEEAFDILRGLGDALAYAHAQGVVHGDIRPGAIFVTTSSIVKVLDLLPATVPRVLPLFPEDSAANGVAAPDPSDDVYGLACVAYELFAGKHPFHADSALEALTAGLAPAPIPRLAARQWDALARGLALRREERTASVAEFLVELGVTVREPPQRSDEVETDPAAAGAPESAPAAAGAAPDRGISAPAFFSEAAIERASQAPPPRSSRSEPRVSGTSGEMWEVGDVVSLFRRDIDDEPPEPASRRRSFVWVVALVVGAAIAAAYWNYGWLETNVPEWLASWSALVEDVSRRAAPRDVDRAVPVAPTPAADTSPRPAVVAAAPTPSAPAPSNSVPAAAPPVASVAPPPATGVAPPSGPAPAIAAAAPASSVPGPATTGTAPPVAETFVPEKPIVVVSRRAATAAITVRRDGDSHRSASLVWWTTDGTAVADKDYVDLGARIEKFAPGEPARTIYVPIVHDSKRGGRKSFYVNLRPGQADDRRDPGQRVEVVIDDAN